MATATAQPAANTKSGGNAKGGSKAPAPVALRPFFTGTLDLETHTYVQSGTLGTSQIPLPTFYPKTNGFLCNMWIDVVVTSAGNSATVAFNEDYPQRAIAVFQLSDTGGQPILGPMSGWELQTFVKWGGFSFSDDPTTSQTYSATTGAGGTGGSFGFILQIPIQFVTREPLGALPNTNSNNAYAVDVTLSTIAQIYSTAPTAAPTYVVKYYQDAYRQSSGKDSQGNATVTTPPGLGAVLYLRRNTLPISNGSQDIELSQQEGLYRALHLVLRDSNGTRATGDTDWPDPCQVYFNNDVPYDRPKRQWIRRQERDYGYTAAAGSPGGRDLGTFTLPFITDNGGQAGSEDRYKYLQVSAADTLGYRGTLGGSGVNNLTCMYNFVRPPGGNIKKLTAR
jgi:hypothetical protein